MPLIPARCVARTAIVLAGLVTLIAVAIFDERLIASGFPAVPALLLGGFAIGTLFVLSARALDAVGRSGKAVPTVYPDAPPPVLE